MRYAGTALLFGCQTKGICSLRLIKKARSDHRFPCSFALRTPSIDQLLALRMTTIRRKSVRVLCHIVEVDLEHGVLLGGLLYFGCDFAYAIQQG